MFGTQDVLVINNISFRIGKQMIISTVSRRLSKINGVFLFWIALVSSIFYNRLLRILRDQLSLLIVIAFRSCVVLNIWPLNLPSWVVHASVTLSLIRNTRLDPMQNLVALLIAIWWLLMCNSLVSSSPSWIGRRCTSWRHRSGFELIVYYHIMNVIMFLDGIMLIITLSRSAI